MTTDTRAALDAAIDAYVRAALVDANSLGAPDAFAAATAAFAAVEPAITAHVEAEIARRLACAPGVGEAMEALESAALTEGGIYATDRDAARLDDTRKALRAAIAADKARAVEAALLRQRAAIEVASQTDADLGALAKDGVMACPTCDHERLPREDAERLIDAFALASSTRQKRAARNHDGRDDWDREATARTALLRALGVEA